MADRKADQRGGLNPGLLDAVPAVTPPTTVAPSRRWVKNVVRWITGADRRDAEAKARADADGRQKAEYAERERRQREAQEHDARLHQEVQEQAEAQRAEQATAQLEAAMASNLPLLMICTRTGGTFYARRTDWMAARERGDRDVPLCTEHGEELEETAHPARRQLRLTTIEGSVIYPVDVPSLDARVDAEEPPPRRGISL